MNTTTTMHSLRKPLLAALFALGMAAGAHAQTAGAAPQGRHAHAASMEERQAKFAEHMAKRQAALHDALKLTPAQEPAWTAFVNATAPAPHAPVDRAALANLSAPERMERMIAMHNERSVKMEAHLAALKTFYAQLTPEQQSLFDAAIKKAHHGGRRGGFMHHGQG